MRIASVSTRTGDVEQAVDSLRRAVAVNPANPVTQHALGRVLVETGRQREVYDHYHQMVTQFPRDPHVFVNLGILANRLDREEEAVASWRMAVALDPEGADAHVYLAELLDSRGEIAAALPHYDAYLSLVTTRAARFRAEPGEIIPVLLKFADAHARLDRLDTSLELYGTAITMARQTSERRLEGFAHSRMADLHDRLGDLVPAARAYQRALALDVAAEDARGESLDWFNYGRFLQRHGLPARLAYACFLRSEALFDSALGGQLDTITKARAQAEAMLGDDAAEVRRDLQSVLSEALGLTDADFAFAPSP